MTNSERAQWLDKTLKVWGVRVNENKNAEGMVIVTILSETIDESVIQMPSLELYQLVFKTGYLNTMYTLLDKFLERI